MISSVLVENELPAFLQCKGKHHDETTKLTLQQLVLFMERDIHCYLKNLNVLAPTFTIGIAEEGGSPFIKIDLELASINASAPLVQRIEDILWAYNSQTLSMLNGEITPHPPRFRYHLTITSRDGGSSILDKAAEERLRGEDHGWYEFASYVR